MVVWWWQGDAESPQFILSLLTAGAGRRVERHVLDRTPSTTSCSRRRPRRWTSDAQVELVQQMQQIAYEASPYLIFGYPSPGGLQHRQVGRAT